MAKIAVFGGTFNPFHIGHYEILAALCKNEMFDKVLLMPDRIPPHKAFKSEVEDSDRIEMCRIACEDFDKAQLCLIEFEREGKSYTVDTVKALKKLYPGDEFFVACGADMINSLDTWYRFDELKKQVTFIAFDRADDEQFKNSIQKMRSAGADILVFEDKITDISSSKLRKHLDRKYLPERVWEYVDRRGIYKQ